MVKPNVKNYLNCYLYLQDIYQFSKHSTPDFSYQYWCYSLDVKSKSYLRFAILGKRKISPELCSKLAKWLSLEGTDSEYFLLLVEYSQSTSDEIKKTLSQKMLQHIRLDQSQIKVNIEKLTTSEPLFIQIRDLLSFSDCKHTAQSLSRLFNKTETEIQTALDFLQDKKWIQKNNDQTWMATNQSIKIEDDQGNSIIQAFHENSLKEALQHLKTNDLERKFRCLHLALSESEFTEFHQKVSDYMTQLFNEFSTSQTSIGKKLFQINYNISPRTQFIDAE